MDAFDVGLYLKRMFLPLFFLVASGCGGNSGSDQISVPALSGLAEPVAFNKLTAAGLMLSAYTQQFSTTVPADAVISQSPAAGTAVSKGAQVAVVISEGPPITVPNVVGETQAAATANCISAELAFNVASTQFSSTIAAGVIISQSPSAGWVVSVNSNVLGVVYGAATFGGEYGQGAVFSIDATGTEAIVYSFSGCTEILIALPFVAVVAA